MSEEKTPEQLAAEAQAKVAAEAQAKADEKARKAAEKAEAKAKADADKAAAKAAKEAEKAAAKAKKDAEAKAKEDAKAAQKAAKEATKMPEQNGVRRPKPDGACGKVWALADSLSASLGQPVPIAALSQAASAQGINDSTIRTQYALWRKFHGVSRRATLPPPAVHAADGQAASA